MLPPSIDLKQVGEFDFNLWSRLAMTDPENFERLRARAVEKIFEAGTVNEKRLRGLQFQIDMERKRARNPLNSCIKISCLMWESFFDMRDSLNEHPFAEYRTPDRQKQKRFSAQVIEFPTAK